MHPHNMVLLHQKLRRRRKRVQQVRIAPYLPVRLGHVAHVGHGNSWQHRSDMRPEHAVGRKVVREIRRDGVPVRDAEVISFKTAFKQKLPVRCDIEIVNDGDPVVGQTEPLEILCQTRKPVVDFGHLGAFRVGNDPDEAVSFRRGQTPEAALRARKVGKSLLLLRHGAQLALVRPAPAVIRAGENPFATGSLPLKLCASVTANVQKCTHGFVLVAGQQNWQAEEIFCKERAFSFPAPSFEPRRPACGEVSWRVPVQTAPGWSSARSANERPPRRDGRISVPPAQ